MSARNEVEMRLNSLDERVRKLEAILLSNEHNSASVSRTKKPSAKEFLMTKLTKTEAQKVLALGYYLEYSEGLESFNIRDLDAIFRSAKEKPPKNLNDAVNKNIARGLIMEAASKKDSKKAWCLTSTGEHYVENDMST